MAGRVFRSASFLLGEFLVELKLRLMWLVVAGGCVVEIVTFLKKEEDGKG